MATNTRKPWQTHRSSLFNKEFAKQNEVFKLACELAKVEPTSRQASKFRRGLGLAIQKKAIAIWTIENRKRLQNGGAK